MYSVSLHSLTFYGVSLVSIWEGNHTCQSESTNLPLTFQRAPVHCFPSLRSATMLTSGLKSSSGVTTLEQPADWPVTPEEAKHCTEQQPVLSPVQGSVAQPWHLAEAFAESSTELTGAMYSHLESRLSGSHLGSKPLHTSSTSLSGSLTLSLFRFAKNFPPLSASLPDFFFLFSNHFLLTFFQWPLTNIFVVFPTRSLMGRGARNVEVDRVSARFWFKVFSPAAWP